MCSDYDMWHYIINSSAKVCMIKNSLKYRIDYTVKGRLNLGGIKVLEGETCSIKYTCPIPIGAFCFAFMASAANYKVPTLAFKGFQNNLSNKTFIVSIYNLIQQIQFHILPLYEPGPITTIKILSQCAYCDDPNLTHAIEEKRYTQTIATRDLLRTASLIALLSLIETLWHCGCLSTLIISNLVCVIPALSNAALT